MAVPPERPRKPPLPKPLAALRAVTVSVPSSGVRATAEETTSILPGRDVIADDAEQTVVSPTEFDDEEPTRALNSGRTPAPEPSPSAPSTSVPSPSALSEGAAAAPRPHGVASHVGRYEVVRRLAFGGMAEVFLARETTTVGATRLVAIKRMLPHLAEDEQFTSMFLDESRVALQLQHPHICTCYEVGREDGSPFLVMEYIDGRSLAKVVELGIAGGGLPPEIAVRIIAQAAEGLHYAHRARDANGEPLHIVHRDVSPSNIMIGRTGQVKVLDFGVAKARSHATKTHPGMVKGKFAYMAPEQCRGQVVDARADVFALGLCLYEVLTGRALYVRDTEFATITALLEEAPPSICAVNPRLPAQLDQIVQLALAKKPEERFASALDLQMALEAWLATTGTFMNAARIAAGIDRLAAARVNGDPKPPAAPAIPATRVNPAVGSLASNATAQAPERYGGPTPVAPLPSAISTDRMAPASVSGGIPIWVLPLVVAVAAIAAIAVGALWLVLH